MDTPQVIAIATSVVGMMAGAVGLVWRAGEEKSKRIEAVWQGRLDDASKVNEWLKQQLTDLKITFATEAKEDRLVLEKLREMLTSEARPTRPR